MLRMPYITTGIFAFVLYGPILQVSCGHDFKECGMRNTRRPGVNSGHLEYPWHVALYKEINADEPPKYICGGSIIHQKLILTAAHCIYDEATPGIANGTFIVAAGKYNSSFDFREPAEQKFKVVDIKIPEAYFGRRSRYIDNIAVITLNESIVFSYVVMPVCIDWKSEVHQTFMTGTVVGWGVNENNVINSELAAAEIEYYNNTFCRSKVEKGFIGYVSSDTFCAAPDDSPAVQRGSSGGGFVVPLNSTNLEKYYLHGILSLKNIQDKITIYTDLKKHLSWLASSVSSVINAGSENFVVDYSDDFEDCGMRYAINSHTPTINYGFEARYSEYPWHVALYRQLSATHPPEYICGGSIVHRKLIITAAHCFYNDTTFGITNATYTAITGKYHRSWDYKDTYEQRFNVIDVKISETYRGLVNRFADDLAVLVLNNTIRFNSVVMPICIEWNPDSIAKEISDTGTVVGWGLTENGSLSATLMVAKLKFFNFTTCNNKLMDSGFTNFVTSDKFCAGLGNSTTVDEGDSGGGLVFQRDSVGNKQQYYIRGIVSTKDRSGTNIAAFTDINKHLKWLNDTISPFIGAEYCRRLSSSYVELAHCKFNSTIVDCNRLARTGTTAKVLCSRSFHSEFPYRLYTETECLKNHNWSLLMESCIECGKRYKFNDIAPLVTFKPRKVSEFPWHVALYRMKSGSNKEFQYICGGTILHPKAVLTAAHCVTDSDGTVINSKLIYVVAGKYEVGWNIQRPFEQRFQVSKTYLRSTYYGAPSLYADDIAVLELNGTISLSDYIMPACIDWTGKLQLHKRQFNSALSPGWGLNEDGVVNEELRTASLLFVNRAKCQQRLTTKGEHSFIDYLSSDKWCAASQDGSLPSKGDSGGSLTFPWYNEETGERVDYVYGLVSVKPIELDILGITDILFHIEWIKDIMISIISKMK